MTGAFTSGLSGLRANQSAVETVGHNIANLNTPGFKTNTVNFRDVLSVTNDTAGQGTAAPIVVRQFSQGSIQQSQGVLDAAISGDGFFILRGDGDQMLFTRAGSFQVDATGHLIAPTGERVLGWSAIDGQLDTNGPISEIAAVDNLQKATKTGRVSLGMNLNAAGLVGQASGTFTTGIEFYDSLGNSHTMKFQFTKTDANQWDYEVTMPAADFGGTGAPTSLTTGSIEFDENGTLITPTASAGTIDLAISGLSSGAADMTVKWDLYSPTGTPFLAQMSLASSVAQTTQDGAPAAEVLGLKMGDGGKLMARLSNGREMILGQIALARFRNPSSLEALGNNFFVVGTDTSAPAIGAPETGGRGKVSAQALEGSTVDLAQEFTNLIVYQRGYQASSRVITTADQMSQETINILR